MSSEQKSLACGGSTEVGFVVDRGEGNRRSQPQWWEGRPKRSLWMGIKKTGRRMKVVAYRCTRCGLLMEFIEASESERRR